MKRTLSAEFVWVKKCLNCGTYNGAISISCTNCGLLLMEKSKECLE